MARKRSETDGAPLQGRLAGTENPDGDNLKGGGDFPTPIRTSFPNELLRHNISNEELDMLTGSQRDHFREAAWAFVGIAAGSILPAIRDFNASYIAEKPIDLSLIGLAGIVLCAVSIVGSVVAWTIVWNRSKSGSKLAETIRNRTRQTSGHIAKI